MAGAAFIVCRIKPRCKSMIDENNKDNKEDTTNTDVQEVVFKYLKSNFYRVIHANGAFGGLTARGEIHIGFYSERMEFPDSSKLTISPNGQVSPEQFEGVGNVVREVEVDVVVDLGTARQLRAWLDDKISVMETLIKQAQKDVANHAEEIAIPEA